MPKITIRIVNKNNTSPYFAITNARDANQVNEAWRIFCRDADKGITDPGELLVKFIRHTTFSGSLSVYLPDGAAKHIELEPRQANIVEFVYKKDNGQTDWRRVDMVKKTKETVEGYDLNDSHQYKTFKTVRIIGNRLMPLDK